MNRKKADPVSTDEAEEMNFGCMDSPIRNMFGEAQEMAKMRPHELANSLIRLILNSLFVMGVDTTKAEEQLRDDDGSETVGAAETSINQIRVDLCLFLAIWGRARKEEAAPALRRRILGFLKRENDVRESMRSILEKLDAALKAADELANDVVSLEEGEEDGS